MMYTQSQSNPCTFTKQLKDDEIIIVFWVDDIIIAACDLENIKTVKSELSERFKIG